MKRIALIGPGAIGGSVIVRLANTREHHILVCARSPVSQFVLEAPDGKWTVTPEVHLAPPAVQPVDWILVATKAYDVLATVKWFKSLAGPNTKLAILQNGVEHTKRFAAYFPESQIVPVVVDLPVEREQAGYFRQRRPGILTVPAGPNGEEFARLFENTGLEIVVTRDFQTALWRKLAVNCAGAVMALVLQPARISHQPEIAEIMRRLVRECIAVGRAEGATLEDSLADWVVERYQKSAPDAVNSLHADRLAGRPLEIDIRNTVIVRLGKQHGIAAPVNQMIAALLETANRPPSGESIPARADQEKL